MPRYINDLPRLGEPARIHQVFQTVLECAPGQLLLQGVQNRLKAAPPPPPSGWADITDSMFYSSFSGMGFAILGHIAHWG